MAMVYKGKPERKKTWTPHVSITWKYVECFVEDFGLLGDLGEPVSAEVDIEISPGQHWSFECDPKKLRSWKE